MNKIYSKTHRHTNSEIKILKAFRIIKTGHAQQKTMWWEKTMEFLEATPNAVKQSLKNSKRKLPTT